MFPMQTAQAQQRGGGGGGEEGDEEEPRAAARPARPAYHRWWRLWALTSMECALSSQGHALGCLVVPRASSLRGRAKGEFAGLILATAALAALFLLPLVPALSDRRGLAWGRRRPLVALGSALCAVTMTLVAALCSSADVALLAALVAANSAGAAIVRAAWERLVADVVRREQAPRVEEMRATSRHVGALVGAGFVAAVFGGTSNAAAMTVIVVLVALAAIGTFLFDEPTHAHTPPRFSCAGVWSEMLEPFQSEATGREFTLLFASRLAGDMGLACFRSFTFFYLTDMMRGEYKLFGGSVGVQETALGILFVFWGVACVAGLLLCRALAPRVGAKPLLYASGLAQALGAAVAALYPTYPAAIAGACVYGLGAGGWHRMSDAVAREVAGGAPLGAWALSEQLATVVALPLQGLVLDALVRRGWAAVAHLEAQATRVGLALVATLLVMPLQHGLPRRPVAAAEQLAADADVWS
eukprot:m51a1_g260 hypothetical protein (471) ;mRNA; r:222542-224156